uniref:Putative reverse transcriptase domain-containing protein n=1 Tax=Tanacetum cinerariifolium TaxID=118510 RepID=A0A6L2KN00_TANCI|nr:putative reverse transcriptase domain-containing protein [Tanacetum cinerariifolium]
MVNLPPPNNDPNVLEDEHAPAREHAPIAPNPEPIQPNNYLVDDEGDPDEEPKEEEEPDDEEEVEAKEKDEEEMEAEEDEDIEVEDNEEENEAEITHPYEEADPLNRPPPSLETTDQEFINATVSQNTLQPLPPIWQFSGTVYVGEGSSTTVFNPALSKVYAPGPMINDPSSLYARVKTLTKQIFNDDLEALDSTLREQIQEMKKLMAELNERFQQIQKRDLRAKNEMLRIRLGTVEEKAEYKLMEAEYYKNHLARVSWDNAVCADAASDRGGEGVNTTAVVKDVVEKKGDKGDDVAAAKDSQPLKFCGSSRHQWLFSFICSTFILLEQLLNRTMPTTRRSQTNPQLPLTQKAINQLVRVGIEAAIRVERERVREEPPELEVLLEAQWLCQLCRWFERMESTFGISKCAERRKVKFATTTLHGRALTWWNSQIATLGLKVANGKPCA